jgi:hypothetical protein
MQMELHFQLRKWEKRPPAPFFTCKINLLGQALADVMALLELVRMIPVGMMAAFGNEGYEMEV